MKALKVAVKTLIASGLLLLVLGVIIWTADADQLVGIHIALGIVLVLSLWTICFFAARAGVATGTVAFAAGWGVLVTVLGLTQEELVTGDLHWTIQVLHVAISMGAIWWGRRLAKAIQQRGAERAMSAASRPTVASTTSR